MFRLFNNKIEKGFNVKRDLNREIKIMFDDNGIGIPFPQVSVSYDEGSDTTKVSKTTKKDAEIFVAGQKVKSKDIEDKNDKPFIY